MWGIGVVGVGDMGRVGGRWSGGSGLGAGLWRWRDGEIETHCLGSCVCVIIHSISSPGIASAFHVVLHIKAKTCGGDLSNKAAGTGAGSPVAYASLCAAEGGRTF